MIGVRRRVILWLCLGLSVAPLATASSPEPRPRIAIIIDDLGYRSADDRRVMDLPPQVAVAIIPHSPLATDLARMAHAQTREILLHLPMQSQGEIEPEDRRHPHSLDIDTTRTEFTRSFRASLNTVPFASGVNNHMGSVLTRHPGHMGWLMEELRCHAALYFVDSFTTPKSVALNAAHERGVPAVRRDVFLDTDLRPDSVRAAFARLKRVARRNGVALAIGHPHPETIAALTELLPLLAAEGFELVAPRDLLREPVTDKDRS
jgi:polysaccharide deacetylase 2 family uncharacterized protein YibQ